MRQNENLLGKLTTSVFIVEDGCVLMLFHRALQRWLPPGGKLNPNELPENAAHREVLEETGLLIRLQGESEELLPDGVHVLTQPHHMQWEPGTADASANIDFIFFANRIGGILEVDLSAFDDFQWMDHNQLRKCVSEEEVQINAFRALEELALS